MTTKVLFRWIIAIAIIVCVGVIPSLYITQPEVNLVAYQVGWRPYSERCFSGIECLIDEFGTVFTYNRYDRMDNEGMNRLRVFSYENTTLPEILNLLGNTFLFTGLTLLIAWILLFKGTGNSNVLSTLWRICLVFYWLWVNIIFDSVTFRPRLYNPLDIQDITLFILLFGIPIMLRQVWLMSREKPNIAYLPLFLSIVIGVVYLMPYIIGLEDYLTNVRTIWMVSSVSTMVLTGIAYLYLYNRQFMESETVVIELMEDDIDSTINPFEQG